jgi:hypothetical protein
MLLLLQIILTASQANIMDASLEFTPKTVAISSTYNFSATIFFGSTDGLGLRIGFPSVISISDSEDYPCSSSNLNPSIVCKSNSNIIQIDNAFVEATSTVRSVSIAI